MKKAKKIIMPVVLVLCLCAACVLLFVNYREARKYQPPINGISWGMTSDEVIKKLNLSQENVEKDEYGNIHLSYENATVFNQKANIRMFFDTQSKINLSSMTINFTKLTEDELINQLKPIYGPGFGKIFSRWSDGKIKDLPQKIQDRIKYERIDLPFKYNIFSFGLKKEYSQEELEERWEAYQNYPLVRANLNGTSLGYSGEYMAVAAIASDDEKYNAWIEYVENLYKNRPNQDSTNESK